MIEVREIDEPKLSRLIAIHNTVWPQDRLTAEDLVDWKRQAEETLWLLAADADGDVGAGIGVHGWHVPPGVGRAVVLVLPSARGRGAGSALLERLGAWLGGHGCREATAEVSEDDDSSIAWAARRGFAEVGRNSTLVLDLSATEMPAVAPPAGVEIVAWAGRPELAAGLYEVYKEASPDIPGEDDTEISSFDDWLLNDMQGLSDRPEATFVALNGDEVVGYAKLSISAGGSDVAWHDLTGVKRAWRGRGIAGALKRAEIAWAKESGYRRLQTRNEQRNEPIRRLNEKHGYRLEPGFVTVRGQIPTERDSR